MIRRIHDSASNIRIFGFDRIKMPFTGWEFATRLVFYIPPSSFTSSRGRFRDRRLALECFPLSHVAICYKRQPTLSFTRHSTHTHRQVAFFRRLIANLLTTTLYALYPLLTIDEDSSDDHTQQNAYIHPLSF